MFDFKCQSDYVVAAVYVICIVALIVMIISGIMSRSRLAQGQDISKTLAGKILIISSTVTIISIVYICTLMVIDGNLNLNRKLIFIGFFIIALGIIIKAKPKWGFLKQIIVSILVCAFFILPVVGFLHWDETLREELRVQEKEAVNKVIEEMPSRKIDNGLTLDKVLRASGYNYVDWSGYYSDYDDSFYVSAYCKKSENSSYNESLKFSFIYDPATDDLELDYIVNVGSNVCNDEESQQIFNELIEKAQNNQK